MAISTTKLLQTKQSLPVLAFITIFLMLLNRANSSDSLSFSFDGFKQDERNLILQGDAHIPQDNNVLQLTRTDSNGLPVSYTVGRALYLAEVHLWEKSTNRLANFQIQFSFSLTSPRSIPADGLAVFMAPSDTTIPPGSDGGTLGLFDPKTARNSSANQVVAVEFDTFYDRSSNDWDPNYQHIGINVNNIKSEATVRWQRREGELLNVLVTYDPATRKLAVVATYPDGQRYEVSYEVDMRSKLPEWVRVGFSAASGQEFQTHTLHSWSFTSTLLNTVGNKNEYIVLPHEM